MTKKVIDKRLADLGRTAEDLWPLVNPASVISARRLRPHPPAHKRNPGEFDKVQRQLATRILDGMAWTLWEAANPEAGEHPDYIPAPAYTAANALVDRIVKAEGVPSIVDLYALAVQIDTGEEFEYVEEHPPKRPEPEFFLDSARGTSIPQAFAEQIDHSVVTGVSEEDWFILESGGEDPDPDDIPPGMVQDFDWNNAYWEVWDDITDQNAVKITTKSGVTYYVDQTENGDVFLVPEGMVQSEDGDEFWVWEEPPPKTRAEQFGAALAHMALGDGQSWFDDHKQTSDDGRIVWQAAIPHVEVSYDDKKYEFAYSFDGKPTKASTTHRVRVTFQSVTPGANDDDPYEEESGWEDEEGTVIEEYAHDDEPMDEAAARFIHYHGPVEPSSSSFHPGVWYTQTDGNENYQTGERRYLGFHLDGFTEDEQRAVFKHLTGRS